MSSLLASCLPFQCGPACHHEYQKKHLHWSCRAAKRVDGRESWRQLRASSGITSTCSSNRKRSKDILGIGPAPKVA